MIERAHKALDFATKAGANNISINVGSGSSTQLSRRDGFLEKASESRSMGMSLRLMVEDKFSSHSTSDLRPQALDAFVERAIEATRFLEPDPDFALPDRELCRQAEGDLDIFDESQVQLTPDQRREWVSELEAEVLAQGQKHKVEIRSISTYQQDSTSEAAIVYSNGFEASAVATSFGHGATITLVDGEKLPSSVAWSTRAHKEDLPSFQEIAENAWERVLNRLGSHAAPSGYYPMLLDRRVVGKFVGMLLGPISGSAIHQGRSCLADKLFEQIGPDWLTIIDKPIIPRAAGSRLFDGDGFPAQDRVIVENGFLKTFLVGQYYSKKLKIPPTSASTSNLVFPDGEKSVSEIIAHLPLVIHIDAFLGGSSNSTTGDFSFGVSGLLYKNGSLVHSVSEMNIAGNFLDVFPKMLLVADDKRKWGSLHCGSVLFDAIQFSGS